MLEGREVPVRVADNNWVKTWRQSDGAYHATDGKWYVLTVPWQPGQAEVRAVQYMYDPGEQGAEDPNAVGAAYQNADGEVEQTEAKAPEAEEKTGAGSADTYSQVENIVKKLGLEGYLPYVKQLIDKGMLRSVTQGGSPNDMAMPGDLTDGIRTIVDKMSGYWDYGRAVADRNRAREAYANYREAQIRAQIPELPKGALGAKHYIQTNRYTDDKGNRWIYDGYGNWQNLGTRAEELRRRSGKQFASSVVKDPDSAMKQEELRHTVAASREDGTVGTDKQVMGNSLNTGGPETWTPMSGREQEAARTRGNVR